MNRCTNGLTAFIFARGGSKGLPGKNIRPLADKPLIGWAIQQALAVPRIERVIVSTDSQQIADVAQFYGADAPFLRPASLASDAASEIDSWKHALSFLKDRDGSLPAAFISVPATAPLRLPEDIEGCIAVYEKGGADVVLTVSPAYRNPWFNMVSSRPDGTFFRVNNSAGSIVRRQDAPDVYDITTVAYVADPEFILSGKSLFDGKVRASVVPPERSIDIDTQHDFDIAEFLMKKRLGEY